MGKILTFGELLLRVCPDEAGEWLKENNLPFYVGGAELNVATALALWQIPAAYLTALPDNVMSKQVIGYLEDRNVDTSRIQLQGDRIGLYYLHKGKDLKNAGVIYDRANSSFTTLKAQLIDWDIVFEDVSWFHLSAICPALTPGLADFCIAALKEASVRNLEISLDLNYREKLWKYGKLPLEVMPELARYCTLIMGNIWAAEKMLGIGIDEELIRSGDELSFHKQASATSAAIMDLFPKCRAVANTFRFNDGAAIRYYSTIYADDELKVSRVYTADRIVDQVGSGDCFMAALIYGFYMELEVQEILDFATAAAFTKLFVAGDATNLDKAQIEAEIKQYEN
jgi:2-dehydro-3-deoxygluconokinase